MEGILEPSSSPSAFLRAHYFYLVCSPLFLLAVMVVGTCIHRVQAVQYLLALGLLRLLLRRRCSLFIVHLALPSALRAPYIVARMTIRRITPTSL